MLDLRQQLREILDANTAVVGVGNPAYGDDGAGVWLAEALRAAGGRQVYLAHTTPENLLPRLAREGVRTILLLDAVDFGGLPGAVALFSGQEIQRRFPQVSTHKISLGTLATLMEQQRGIPTWLLGIQPRSLQPGEDSAIVQKSVRLLAAMLGEILHAGSIPQGLNVNSPGWNPVEQSCSKMSNPGGVE